MLLRIATYNIHRCVGCNGVESHGRIAGVLRDIDADVIGLQEIAFNTDSPNNVIASLARSMDAEAIAGPTLQAKSGRYGNAILSRIAPESIDRLDISVPGREPRGALAVNLRFSGRSVRVVTTHLGLRPRERRYQVRCLLPLLDDPQASVTILLGDFNEWLPWGRPLRWINLRFGSLPTPATFPSRRPLLALDRIWVDPADRLSTLYRHRSPLAVIASDHLPLVANVAV